MDSKQEYAIGDTVYVDCTHYSADVRVGRVVKITPTGRVNVAIGTGWGGDCPPIIYQFKGGMQTGGDRWHPYRLIDRDAYERLAVRMNGEKAMKAIASRAGERGFTDKASVLAWIEELRVLADAVPEGYKAR